MNSGTMLLSNLNRDELSFPTFIWGHYEYNGEKHYILNSDKGYSKTDIEKIAPQTFLLLPNHSKFKILVSRALREKFAPYINTDYQSVSDQIVLAYKNPYEAGSFLVNMAYAFLHLIYCVKFTDTQYCESAQQAIANDPHSLIKKFSGIKDENERNIQITKNIAYNHDLEFIPKRFGLLKLLTTYKDIARSNFPSRYEHHANALVEPLILGMAASYYFANRDKIKSTTINYSNNFPGEFKVFKDFLMVLDKCEEEAKMYERVNLEQKKIELEATLNGFKIPERKDGKGILIKLLEFDLAYWQPLFLLGIDQDVPVRKPFKDGYSESHNFMLLLPFFKWLAPHQFHTLQKSTFTKDTYSKNMVARMKNFVEGKIS